MISGYFNLPVYKGPVSKRLLARLETEQETDSKKIIAELLKQGDISYMGTVQVVAKAVDSQRSGHFMKLAGLPSSRFVPQTERYRFILKSSPKNAKILSEIISDSAMQRQVADVATIHFTDMLKTL
jgi:hypothetical protein